MSRFEITPELLESARQVWTGARDAGEGYEASMRAVLEVTGAQIAHTAWTQAIDVAVDVASQERMCADLAHRDAARKVHDRLCCVDSPYRNQEALRADEATTSQKGETA